MKAPGEVTELATQPLCFSSVPSASGFVSAGSRNIINHQPGFRHPINATV